MTNPVYGSIYSVYQRVVGMYTVDTLSYETFSFWLNRQACANLRPLQYATEKNR